MSKPPLLHDLEHYLLQVIFGTASGVFCAEPALKLVLDNFCPRLLDRDLTDEDARWFPRSLDSISTRSARSDQTSVEGQSKTQDVSPQDGIQGEPEKDLESDQAHGEPEPELVQLTESGKSRAAGEARSLQGQTGSTVSPMIRHLCVHT